MPWPIRTLTPEEMAREFVSAFNGDARTGSPRLSPGQVKPLQEALTAFLERLKEEVET